MNDHTLIPLIKQTLKTSEKRTDHLRNLKLAIEQDDNEKIKEFASLLTGLKEEVVGKLKESNRVN